MKDTLKKCKNGCLIGRDWGFIMKDCPEHQIRWVGVPITKEQKDKVLSREEMSCKN